MWWSGSIKLQKRLEAMLKGQYAIKNYICSNEIITRKENVFIIGK